MTKIRHICRNGISVPLNCKILDIRSKIDTDGEHYKSVVSEIIIEESYEPQPYDFIRFKPNSFHVAALYGIFKGYNDETKKYEFYHCYDPCDYYDKRDESFKDIYSVHKLSKEGETDYKDYLRSRGEYWSQEENRCMKIDEMRRIKGNTFYYCDFSTCPFTLKSYVEDFSDFATNLANNSNYFIKKQRAQEALEKYIEVQKHFSSIIKPKQQP